MITEICADNETVLADEDGEYSDWIEVPNPDPVAVDLTGWALTDEAEDLAKWVFPAVSLAPGEFRVVFASGKDRRDPEGPLHANFALAARGEYLALVGADGVVAHGFAPAFPPQESDRSFGSAFGTEPLLGARASARVLVPGDGGLGMEWIGRGYVPDETWIEGPTGIGFGLLVPGFTVREVLPGSGVYDLFDAERALALADPVAEDSRVRPWLNLLSGESEDGHFPGDEPFGVAPENHALRATGQILLSEPGIWTFGVSANDGARLRIDGSEVLADPNQGGTRDILGSPVELAAVMHAVELVFYSAVGGDALELFAAEGAQGAFGPGFRLVGDVASGGLPAFTLPAGAGPESVIGTDIGDAMRGVNAGAYVRIPLAVSNPEAVGNLSLSMLFQRWLRGVVERDRSGALEYPVGAGLGQRGDGGEGGRRRVCQANVQRDGGKGGAGGGDERAGDPRAERDGA